ncbi:MAG TPA: hypothetical protein VJ453_11580 [Terriglobales bacterium]|nr:hypothetical protein [Terriglobales bacterium]
MKVGFVLILVLICNVSHSQALRKQSGSSAQSSLTVTAIVEPSVWLVMEPDGQSDVFVANAPDPKQSFFHAPLSKPGRKSAALAKAKHTGIVKQPVRNQNSAVQFSFPTGSKQFDVSKRTIMMDVFERGVTARRPVIVTTVVPQ